MEIILNFSEKCNSLLCLFFERIYKTMSTNVFMAKQKTLTKVTQFELSNLIRKTKLFTKIKLTASSRLVLESLVFHYPNIRVNVATLAEETGCSKRSIENALFELKNKGLILTTQTGRSNIFKLTQFFYDLLEIASPPCKKEQVRHAEIALPHNKNIKKQNNKTIFKFKKYERNDLKENKRKYHHNTQLTGINIPKFIPEKLEKTSPLDMTKEQAINFINNLPEQLKNSYFATELRKKWNL